MKSALLIRPATLVDAQAIADIYNQGIAERIATFETEPRTPEMIEALLQANEGRFPTVVVERDGAVVAWARAAEYSSRPCYAGIAEFSVYVERSARGTGAGRAALQGLIRACEARGLWKLVSKVFPENTASRGLCAVLGFREVGLHLRHARLDGAWHDCILVERLLGEALESLPSNREG